MAEDERILMETQLKKVMLDWSDTFMRLSLNELSRFAHSNGLSLAQMSILTHLHYQGVCEVTSFSEMLQISRPAASQMIERLVQSGVVHRFGSLEDRRKHLVELTELGKRVVSESMEARVIWINQLTQEIPEKDQNLFSNVFRRLINYTKKLDPNNFLEN